MDDGGQLLERYVNSNKTCKRSPRWSHYYAPIRCGVFPRRGRPTALRVLQCLGRRSRVNCAEAHHEAPSHHCHILSDYCCHRAASLAVRLACRRPALQIRCSSLGPVSAAFACRRLFLLDYRLRSCFRATPPPPPVQLSPPQSEAGCQGKRVSSLGILSEPVNQYIGVATPNNNSRQSSCSLNYKSVKHGRS